MTVLLNRTGRMYGHSGGASVQMFTQASGARLEAAAAEINNSTTYVAFSGVVSGLGNGTTTCRMFSSFQGGTFLQYLHSTGTLALQVEGPSATVLYRGEVSSLDLSGSTPTHVFASYDSSTATPLIYIDGVAQTPSVITAATTGTIIFSYVSGGVVFFNREGGARPLSGNVSQAVFTTGSALALSSVYDSGIVADLSGLDASCELVLDGSRLSVADVNTPLNNGTAALTINGTFTDGGTITV